MKPVHRITSLLLLASIILSAKEIPVIQPTKPKVGDNISITYDPSAPNALHKNAEDIYVVILLLHTEGTPSIIEQQMVKSGTLWTAAFTLDDAKAVGMFVRFDSGKKIDDNSGNAYYVKVHGKNNKPVPGANLMAAVIFQQKNYYGFKHGFDSAKVIAMLKEEQKLYPNDWKTYNMLWVYQLRQDTSAAMKQRIRKELEKVYAKHKNDEQAAFGLSFWFTMTGQKEKVKTIEAQWLKKNPSGLFAEDKLRMEFMREQDVMARVAGADKYLSQFTAKPLYQAMFLTAYIRAKAFDKAITFIEKYPDVSPSYYNSVAWGLISKGEQLERAIELAKEGLERASRMDMSSRLQYAGFTHDQWVENMEYMRGMIADTYGEGLMKLEKYAEAEKVLEESYMLMKGDDEDNNARLMECYMKNGKNDKAAEVAFTSIVNGKSNDKLIELYKTAYTSAKGSSVGFDSVVAVAKNEAVKELKAKLKKEVIDQPSIDFELKSLDGSMVKLSDLKGKVVVLDFWATWCGPCLSSFPTLQKVYDKYKDNPGIKILTLNTWERVKPEEREQHVKNFMEKNKYTFPVLFDTDVVSQYGVEGIPTKFIIDQNGKIRFKDVGFGGAQEMDDKMNLQFEMLLKGDLSYSGE